MCPQPPHREFTINTMLLPLSIPHYPIINPTSCVTVSVHEQCLQGCSLRALKGSRWRKPRCWETRLMAVGISPFQPHIFFTWVRNHRAFQPSIDMDMMSVFPADLPLWNVRAPAPWAPVGSSTPGPSAKPTAFPPSHLSAKHTFLTTKG